MEDAPGELEEAAPNPLIHRVSRVMLAMCVLTAAHQLGLAVSRRAAVGRRVWVATSQRNLMSEATRVADPRQRGWPARGGLNVA